MVGRMFRETAQLRRRVFYFFKWADHGLFFIYFCLFIQIQQPKGFELGSLEQKGRKLTTRPSPRLQQEEELQLLALASSSSFQLQLLAPASSSSFQLQLLALTSSSSFFSMDLQSQRQRGIKLLNLSLKPELRKNNGIFSKRQASR